MWQSAARSLASGEAPQALTPFVSATDQREPAPPSELARLLYDLFSGGQGHLRSLRGGAPWFEPAEAMTLEGGRLYWREAQPWRFWGWRPVAYGRGASYKQNNQGFWPYGRLLGWLDHRTVHLDVAALRELAPAARGLRGRPLCLAGQLVEVLQFDRRATSNEIRAAVPPRLPPLPPLPSRFDLPTGYLHFTTPRNAEEQLARRLLTDDSDRLTVEVKADDAAERTGNHYVELSCKGRPSGIRTTKAAYWSVALPDGTVVMVPTAKVRRLAAEAEAEGHVARMNRGSHPTRGALVPLYRLVA